MAGVGIGASPFLMRRGGGSYEYSPLSEAYFDAMTVQLTVAQKRVIDTAIKATSAQLAKMDYVNIALATEQQSLINLVNPTQSGTKVGSPTFTAYKGWTGDASNYINTGFNPGDGESHNLKLNDALLFAYKNNAYSAGTRAIFGTTGLSIGIYSDEERIVSYINETEFYAQTFGIKIKEFFGSTRSESSVRHPLFNKQSRNENKASSAVPNNTLKYALTGDRCCLYYSGAHLTDTEYSDFQDAWLPVLEYFGSDYWSNFTPSTPSLTVLGANSIKIDWTNAATTYSPYTLSNVKVQISTNGTDFIDLETLANVTTYTAIGLNPSTQYWFRLIKKSSRNIWTQYTDSANETTTA